MRGRTGTALVRCAPPEPLGNELKHCYRRRSRRCEERCRKAAVEAPLRSPLSARQGLGAPGLLPAHSRTPPEPRFGPYPNGCQDGGRPKNPGRSLPKRERAHVGPYPNGRGRTFRGVPRRVSGRRAAQKPRSVLTQTGVRTEGGPKTPVGPYPNGLVLTQTGKKGLGPYLDGFAPPKRT